MGGMEMMLKSLGFDPAQFQGFITGMQQALQKFNADLEMLKSHNAQLDLKISRLEDRMIELEQNQRAILASVIKPENENGR